MDLVDSKYIGLISSRLQKFKRVKADLYNFRCPLCGDSQKHKNKARGYVYPLKADMNYKCHNCGASSTFSNFLKSLDPTLHKQYVFEKFQTRNTGKGSIIEKPKLDFKKPVFRKQLDLPKASEVSVAKEYLEKRMIDPTKFYFAKKFKEWVNTKKQTFDTIGRDESRIIIPMYDTERNLIGFQGRSLGPNSVKYITVMLDEEAPKVYGMDQIDTKKVSMWLKDLLTQHSSKIVSLCVGVIVVWNVLKEAVSFMYMITNHVIKRLSGESTNVSQEVSK